MLGASTAGQEVGIQEGRAGHLLPQERGAGSRAERVQLEVRRVEMTKYRIR